MKLTLAVMFACTMCLGTVAFATDLRSRDAVDGVLTINSSGDYRLVADFKQLVVQGPTANDVIDVTVDMNGHSISNTEKNILVDIAENKSTVTLTLTNCADRTSYIDGLFAFNEWKSGADYAGRGIRNSASGTVHFGGDITIRRCWTNKGGSGIYNRGTFHMTGGSVGEAATTNETGYCIISCTNRNDGAVFWYGAGVLNYQSSAVFKMTGGSICHCLNKGRFGGGIATCNNGARAELGGTSRIFSNCAWCGGVMAGLESQLIITNDVWIYDNVANGEANSYSGGGVAIGLSGGLNRLDMFGGHIVSNVAEHIGGGGIYMRGDSTEKEAWGEIYIYDGVIEGNKAYGEQSHGGGLYTKGPVYVYGGEIKGNYSEGKGGGIYISDDSDTHNKKFTMTDGLIADNRGSTGGGVYAAQEVEITGGVISNNVATVDNGGGIYVAESPYDFKMMGGLIAYNSAQTNGGGVAVIDTEKDRRNISISDGTILGNSSRVKGGGLYATGGSFEFGGEGLVCGNVAADGGGIYVLNQTMTADGGNIVSNTAIRGGGICISENANATFSGTINISYNVATNLGGGAAMNYNALLEINGGTFSYNQAQMGGGAHLLGGAALTINGGNFFCNRAVYVEGGDRKHTGVGEETEPWNWTTAYATERYDICSGVGGGIYLGKGFDETHVTTLNCPKSDRTGLVGAYSNVADRAGNEIVSAGVLTKVTLPNRVLEDGEGRILHWFEDYYTDDTHYAERWENAPEGTAVGMRYRDAAARGIQQRVWEATAQTGSPYLCLTLGYAVDMPVNSLWITDHADAGDGMVHLAFQPTFEKTVDMAIWIPYARTNNLVRYVVADTEAELASAPLKDDFTFRDGTGDQDAAKGWCWITVPSTNKFCKVVICNNGLGGVQLWED